MTDIPQIQIHEAKKKFDSKACTFIDIRDPGSYRAARIPGAIHLDDSNVQEFIAAADKHKETVVYCYHGNSSLGAVAYFLENGFTKISSMSGGFEAWRQTYEHEGEQS
jgi:thiosulfate sulfurtransferase